jgi:hypothetical protein
MLLKTNGRIEREAVYPTISMIIRRLFENLLKAIYYFQYDGLWKSLGIESNRDQTHDVYDRKWVSPKAKKFIHCFQQDTRRKIMDIVENLGVKPTMCMVERDLVTNQHFSSSSHVIEKRTRSDLALGTDGSGTHDVFQTKWLNPRRPLFDPWGDANYSSLLVAS